MAEILVLSAILLIPVDSVFEVLENNHILLIDEYIKSNISKKILNSELSALISMEKSAFIRYFKKNYGITPQEFVIEKRLEKSCMDLVFSDKTIDEIAENAGFCDRHHFTKLLKKIRGHTPGDFRKRYRFRG